MRKITSRYGTLNIVEHWITKNFWEFYITDQCFNDDLVLAVVMGIETEMGDISRSEVAPYVTIKTTDLHSIMPPVGWKWVES